MKLTARLVLVYLMVGLPSAPVWAKGLDALSDKSPEAAEQQEAKASSKGEEDPAFGPDKEGNEAEATEASEAGGVPTNPPSNALTQRLYMATSYGWVKASRRGGGSWTASGMSDFAVGYRVLPIKSAFNISATYRYAPVALSGQVNGHSYRGVWETHYAGARADTNMGTSVRLVASGELGYLHAALRRTDGLPGEHSAARSGAVAAFGVGADYLLLDGGVLAVGPRLCGSYGVATTRQLAVSVGLSF